MSYCTWDDVSKELPAVLQDNADLAGHAEDMIAGEQALLDARLGERYVVPFVLATSPKAFAWAKKVLSKIVAARAYMSVRSVEGDEEAATWFPKALLASAEAEIERAVEGGAALSDAVEETDEPERNPEDGYSDLTTTEQGYIAPWFKRQDVF